MGKGLLKMPTSKERVLTALNHEESDRVPLDIGGINNTTMHVTIEKKLKRYLGLEDRGSEIKAISQKVVVPDENILRHFGSDTRSIYVAEEPWKYDESAGVYVDQWGIGYKENPDGNYFNFCTHPLAAAKTLADVEAYRFFEPSEAALDGLEERIRAYKGEYCLVLEGFREPMFGLPSWLRGAADFYMDIAADDGLGAALLDRVLAHYLQWTDFVLSRIGKYIDVVKLADDLGTQETLILSPKLYRKVIKPRQAALYQHIKEQCDCKLLLHACGAIRGILPDLIEIGVDAINPVQITAKGMEPAELKKEFGGKLTFWGGDVDTQHTLPFASVAEVKRAVKKNIEIFKQGGGHVFAQVHNITPDVPIENVVAMYEAYREYAEY
jgi:uroporphyrinogen decarboxylase